MYDRTRDAVAKLGHEAPDFDTFWQRGELALPMDRDDGGIVGRRYLPAVAEAVPGYENYGWYSIVVPTGVPKDIIAKMSAELVPQINNPEVKAKFDAFGTILMVSRPEVLATKVRDEIGKWRKVIQGAGIVPE